MNFFAIEELIVRRLREEVKGVAVVFSASDLAEVNDRSQTAPLLAVVYDGYALHSAVRGAVQVVQRWIVVIGTRAGEYADPAATNRRAAGEIATDVITCLQGWQPVEYPNIRPLSLAQAQGTYLKDGLLLVPFVFETNLSVTKGV